MSWSASLPSATTILANAAPWFTALFDEFRIYLYIGVGVAFAFFLIAWLVDVFTAGFHLPFFHRKKDKNWTQGKDSSGWEHSDLP